MFSKLALSALVMAGSTFAAFDEKALNDFRADPFRNNRELAQALARLQQLTTGNPITDECVDAQKKPLAGQALLDCRNKLAQELLDTQINLQKDFFNQLVNQFDRLGSRFEFTRNDFRNVRECQVRLDKFKDIRNNVGVLDAAVVDNCKLKCDDGAEGRAAAALCIRDAVRDVLRAEQLKVNGNVAVSGAELDDAHFITFVPFNAAEEKQFLDISEDADRLAQSLTGLLNSQLAQLVLQVRAKGYSTYQGDVVPSSNVTPDVQTLLSIVGSLIVQRPEFVDGFKRLNALAGQTDGINVGKVFDALARRAFKQVDPIVVRAQFSVLPENANAAVDLFAKNLGQKAEVVQIAQRAKDSNGRIVYDLLFGDDASLINTIDNELGITCVLLNQAFKLKLNSGSSSSFEQIDCVTLENIHKPFFDVFQRATPAPINNNGAGNGGNDNYYNPPPPPPPAWHGGATKAANDNLNSGSTLLLAAPVALLASLLAF